MPHENNRNEGELHPMLDAQVKGFKDLLKASDIAKNAKQKLEEDFNAFVKAEKLSEVESAEHQESAADVVGDSMEVLQKSNKLSDKIQELKRELLKIKEQETEKLLDLNSAIVNAKVLEKDRKFDEAIKELESVADVNDSVDTRRSFNSEYGIRLDRARAALATLYVLSKEYEANKKELDGKREKIIEQLSRNEALRNLCTTIARESLKTPKAFEGIQNFKEWFDPAEIGFNPRFFDLPLEMQQSFVAELSSRVNELQINANIEKAPMPERMFFQAQQKMGAGDLIEATKLLLEYRKTAGAQNRSETAPAAAELRSDRDNPYAVRRASFLEETDGLLRKIALRHCDVVEADLQKLVDDRESQQFRSNENTDFGVAQSNIVRARELITSHKALTFSDAVKQLSLSYRSNDKYDLLFFVEASESKQEQVDLTKRAVESLNELGGSTKLSRDKLDRALSKELSSVEIQQKRKNELRALSNEEAVKHKQEAVVTLEAERDSVSARLTVLDAQLNGGRVLTDKERNSLWQEYNKLTLRLGALTTNGRADGEIKPAVVSQSVEKACDEMYRQLLRRDRYLALAQSGKVTELGKIVLLQKGLTMDNMPDKDFTALSTWIEAAQTHGNSLFSVDQVHQIFQTSCMIALEIAQMSAGSGLGSVVEYGLTKTFATQLAKGGLRKIGIKAGIGLAKAAGEGFASTAAMRTMGAMSLLAEGKDPAEAYDGFAKEWAQSTLMFTSIGAGTALMSGTLGRLAVTTEKGTTRAAQLTLKENPALWLAYNAGQLGVEVETLNAVDHLGAALGLTPNVSDDELQSKINHLANVLKYRAGGKLWNATALGHDMHRAEQELARKSQGVEQSARQESRSQNEKNTVEALKTRVAELKKEVPTLCIGLKEFEFRDVPTIMYPIEDAQGNLVARVYIQDKSRSGSGKKAEYEVVQIATRKDFEHSGVKDALYLRIATLLSSEGFSNKKSPDTLVTREVADMWKWLEENKLAVKKRGGYESLLPQKFKLNEGYEGPLNPIMERFKDPNYLPKQSELKPYMDRLRAAHERDRQSRALVESPESKEFQNWDRFFKEENIFEIFTEEYVDHFSNYLARRAQAFGASESHPLTIVEVGAGSGKLTHFLQKRLNEIAPGAVKIIAVDDGSWKIKTPFLVENIGQNDALQKYNPDLVISSWMLPNTDWTADFRKTPNVKEYILIGNPDEGISGDRWSTWGHESGVIVGDEANHQAPYRADGFERIDNPDGVGNFQMNKFSAEPDMQHYRSDTVSFRKNESEKEIFDSMRAREGLPPLNFSPEVVQSLNHAKNIIQTTTDEALKNNSYGVFNSTMEVMSQMKNAIASFSSSSVEAQVLTTVFQQLQVLNEKAREREARFRQDFAARIATDETLAPEASHVDTSADTVVPRVDTTADTLAPAVKEPSIMKTERGMPKLVFASTEMPIPAQSTQPLPRIETSVAQKNERPTVPGIPRIDFHKLAERAFTTLLKDKFGVDESVVAAVVHEIPKLSQDQIRSFLDSPDSLKVFAEKTVERNEKTARDISDFEKILSQTHRSFITLDVREQVRLVARGESPSGRIGEVLLGLKERDPLAYEIIQKSDPEMLVESGILTAMVRGGEYRKTVENKGGKKLTIYMGSPIKDGGMGTIHYVGLVRDGESTMTFGAMKRAKEISFEDAARLLQTKKKSLKIEKLQAADTPVADDVQNPSNKPVDVAGETGELTDGAHDTAPDVDVATFRDTQNKSRQLTLQKEALAQAKTALRDGRFVQALEITSDAIIYETNPHSGKAYDLVESRDKMTQPEIAGTLAEVIDGLQHLHNNGLIHSDIKPHNIMRIADKDGIMRTKIIDNTPVPIGRLLENSMLSPEAFLADIAYTPAYQRYSPEALREVYYSMLDKGKSPLDCAMHIGRAIDTVAIATTILQQFGGESGPLPQQDPELYADLIRITGDFNGDTPGDIAFAAEAKTLDTLKNKLLNLQRRSSSQTNTTPPLVPISSQDTLGISEVGGGT